MTPDFGPSPAVRERWRQGAQLRAVKRYVSKAVRSVRRFRDDTAEREEFIWRARTRAYGAKPSRMVERNGVALVQRRGPHFHDTVQA